jgi:hypothetical protein
MHVVHPEEASIQTEVPTPIYGCRAIIDNGIYRSRSERAGVGRPYGDEGKGGDERGYFHRDWFLFNFY